MAHWTLLCFPSRFEIEIEPIFGTLALYDVKEKKKVLRQHLLLIVLLLSSGKLILSKTV